jgi:hypothetical protein
LEAQVVQQLLQDDWLAEHDSAKPAVHTQLNPNFTPNFTLNFRPSFTHLNSAWK